MKHIQFANIKDFLEVWEDMDICYNKLQNFNEYKKGFVIEVYQPRKDLTYNITVWEKPTLFIKRWLIENGIEQNVN